MLPSGTAATPKLDTWRCFFSCLHDIFLSSRSREGVYLSTLNWFLSFCALDRWTHVRAWVSQEEPRLGRKKAAKIDRSGGEQWPWGGSHAFLIRHPWNQAGGRDHVWRWCGAATVAAHLPVCMIAFTWRLRDYNYCFSSTVAGKCLRACAAPLVLACAPWTKTLKSPVASMHCAVSLETLFHCLWNSVSIVLSFYSTLALLTHCGS